MLAHHPHLFLLKVDIPVEYLEMEVPTPEVLVKETVTC
jgi:hypothetical protein